jgi:hypothetical protein
MSIIKFSKPSIAVIKNKTSFFEQNEKHLNLVKSVNDVYKMQEARNECKTCSEPLGDIDLIIHEVPYSICENCKHLNGHLHAKSRIFTRSLK